MYEMVSRNPKEGEDMPIPAFIGGALAGAGLVGLPTAAFRNNEETDTKGEESLDGRESEVHHG